MPSEDPRAGARREPLPPGALARLGSASLRHGDTVRDLVFLPDGKALVAADKSGIRLWDTATGRELRRFGDEAVQSISLSADGKLLAASSPYTGPFRLWDVPTGRLLRSIDAPAYSTAVLSPDGKWLASWGGNSNGSALDTVIHLWDARTGRKAHQFRGHTGIVWSLVFSPDGSRLHSGAADGTIRTWDVRAGREVGRIEGHQGKVCHLAVSPDGRLLASVGMHYDKYTPDKRTWATFPVVYIWDTRTRRQVRQIVGASAPKDPWGFPSDGFHALAFTPDGRTLVTTGGRSTVRLWDVTTGKERWQTRLPGTMAYAVAVSPDGRTLAAGDNVIHLWNLETGRELLPRQGHQSALTAVAASPDGRTIATAGHDRTIRLWDREGRQLRRLDSGGGVYSLAFAPSGRELVSSGADRSTRVWEVATGRERRRFPGVASDLGIRWAMSPDGKTVAQALRYESVGLWDVATGKHLRELPEEMVVGLSFSPDSQTLLVCNGDKDVRLYAVGTGKRLRGFATLPREKHRSYQQVQFSPDARWVALWSYRFRQARTHVRVHLFDTSTGKEVRHFEDLGRPLGFAPDSRLLACRSTDDDREVNLVEVATGKLVRRLSGHEGTVHAVAFAGSAPVTAGADANALVWDLSGLAGKAVRLLAREREQRWADLAGADPGRAYQAGAALASTAEGVRFLEQRLRPAPAVAAEKVTRWIREMDDDEFAVRSAATAALAGLGARAEAPLRQALTGKPSPEARRRMLALLQGLERRTLSEEQLRSLRAITALEAAGTREARRLLAELAGGAAGALRTREAKAALGRLTPP
jgi:WD40 repeat protein